MSAFSGFSKTVSDLLSKPFSFDNKVELTTKSSNGLSFVADASVAESGPKANVTVKGKVGAVTVDKFTYGTEKKAVAEFKVPQIIANTEGTLKSSCAGGVGSVTLGAKYESADLGTFVIEEVVTKGPSAELSFLKSFSGVFVGASAKLNLNLYDISKLGCTAAAAAPAAAIAKAESKKGEGKTEAKKAEKEAAPFGLSGLILGYKASDYTVFAQTKGPSGLDTVDIGLTFDAAPLSAGISASVPITKAKPDDAVSVLFGGSYKVDKDTTVFAAVNQKAVVSFAYKQKLNSLATVTVNSQVDAGKIAGDDHKFGLTLSLSN